MKAALIASLAVTAQAVYQVCLSSEFGARADNSYAINCVNSSFTNVPNQCSTSTYGGQVIVNRTAQDASRVVLIKFSQSSAFPLTLGVSLANPIPITDACALVTAPAPAGSGALELGTVRYTAVGDTTNDTVAMCNDDSAAPVSGMIQSNVDLNWVGGAEVPSCSTSPDAGSVTAIAFKYTCPSVAAVPAESSTDVVIQYVEAPRADAFGFVRVVCGNLYVPPVDVCRVYSWCSAPNTEFSGRCPVSTDETIRTNLVTSCTAGGATACYIDETGNCETCGELPGGRTNSFTMCGSPDQIANFTTSVRDGRFAAVPAYATVTQNGDIIPCGSEQCEVPFTPSDTLTALVYQCLDDVALATAVKNQKSSIKADGETVAVVNSGVDGGDCSINARQTSSGTSYWSGAECGDGITDPDFSAACCESFYEYAVCDLELAPTACNCAGIPIPCPKVSCSSSNRGLLGLLALLALIPIGILLIGLCVLLYCFWKRRKQYEERQLMTFDPQPEPAAPPPPVNVYDDHHHHGSHHRSEIDGYSAYDNSGRYDSHC